MADDLQTLAPRLARLSDLCRGDCGFVQGFAETPEQHALIERLREVGFSEDLPFEILHQAPFGGDPIAVKIDRMIVALRRAEANVIEVRMREAAL